MGEAPEQAPQKWLARQTGMTDSHVATRRRGDNYKMVNGVKVPKTGGRGRHLICNVQVGTNDQAYRDNFDQVFSGKSKQEKKVKSKVEKNLIDTALTEVRKLIDSVEQDDSEILFYDSVGALLFKITVTK